MKIEKRKNMWVCEHCLCAIQSREGNQATLCHDIKLEYDEEDFDKMSKCDWCEEDGFTELYELL